MSSLSAEPVLLPTASSAAVRARLRELLRGQRSLVAAAAAALVIGTVATLVVPPLLGAVVDLATGARSSSRLAAILAALIVAGLVGAVLALVADLLIARVGETALADLRESVLERALDLPLGQIEEAGTGDLVARIGGDVATAADAIQRVLPGVLFSGLSIVLTVVGLAALDWRFAIAALAALPIQIGTLRWYVRRCIPLYAAERVADGALAQQLLSSLGGADTVRAYGLGPDHLAKVGARSRGANELAYEGTRLRTRLYGRLNVAELVGLGGVLAIGFPLVRNGTVTLGAATAAALYFHRIFDPVNSVVGLFDDLLVAHAGLARLVGIADIPPMPDPVDPRSPVDASLAVDAVSYGYVAGHEVLHDVTTSAASGERLAVVGPSGAGKSTLAKLVVGIHPPTSGRVRLGTVPIEAVDRADLRRTVALVTQEMHVFAGRLADDLRLARPDADDADLLDALDRVGASWAAELPDGLDTRIGRGGHPLAGIETQQLALARLVLAAPAIVVLDEATAEAGSAGARQLEAAARAATAGATTLIVAHRLTQAATADRILVLDEGRVVEQGTHDELVASGGTYASLWATWSGARRTTNEPA